MRYFVLSYGRPQLQITLKSMPESVLQHIELMIVPAEYEAYRDNGLSQKLKAIHAWPSYLDCVPKKRHWMAQNAKDNYILMDDDVNMYVWSKKENKFVPALREPKAFERHFLEGIPCQFDKFASVACANKFMADQYVRDNGLVKKNSVGFVVSGFRKGAAANVKVGRTFVYTDIDLPLQVYQDRGSSCQYYGIAYNHASNKALEATGTSTYRSEFVKMDSAVRMAMLYPGIVTGASQNNNKGGGWTLQKYFSRVNKGVSDAAIQKSRDFVKELCKSHGLKRPPRPFAWDFKMPREKILDTYTRLWEEAKK